MDPAQSPRARLSADTDRETEDRQIAAWRSASTVELAGIVASASYTVRTLALAGLKSRYPEATPRELVARYALLTLGPDLARKAYPELEHLED